MDNSLKLQSLFQTLGDTNRLKIIRFIGNQSRSVSEIVNSIGLSQPLVSHHLRVLREKNILKTKREGPFIYYELNDCRIIDALGIFSEIIMLGSENKISESMFTCANQLKMYLNKRIGAK